MNEFYLDLPVPVATDGVDVLGLSLLQRVCGGGVHCSQCILLSYRPVTGFWGEEIAQDVQWLQKERD